MGASERRPVSEDGRRLLREACASLGLDSDMGNRIADWLDKHPNAEVRVTGRTPEPPLRVFGTPDDAPDPETPAPFGLQDAPDPPPEDGEPEPQT